MHDDAHLPGVGQRGEAPPPVELKLPTESLSFPAETPRFLNAARKDSSDLVDWAEDDESRRLFVVGCEAKYDAGLKDRLAIAAVLGITSCAWKLGIFFDLVTMDDGWSRRRVVAVSDLG
jgi:hypothetical protein